MNKNKTININKVEALAARFFPDTVELDFADAMILSEAIAPGNVLSQAQTAALIRIFEGHPFSKEPIRGITKYVKKTIHEIVDALNCLEPDPESVFPQGIDTDGNGNSAYAYMLERRDDCRISLGSDTGAQTRKDYYGG